MSSFEDRSDPNASTDGMGSSVVTDARRLLMRVVTHPVVRSLDLAREEPRASTASTSVDLTGAARRGDREDEALPGAPAARAAALPTVPPAENDAGTPLTFYGGVSGDQARMTDDFAVFVRTAPMTVPLPPLGHPVIEMANRTSYLADIHLAGGSIRGETMIKSPEKTIILLLPMIPPSFARSEKTTQRSVSVRFSSPGVQTVPNRISAEVALERRGTSLPSIETPAGRAAHLMTRQLLAKAAGAGVGEDDIVIVGIYRRIPIGAATLLSIDERTNRLCVYLRPDAARVVQSQTRQIVSLVFGRVRSDGRLVRALVQTPNPAAR